MISNDELIQARTLLKKIIIDFERKDICGKAIDKLEEAMFQISEKSICDALRAKTKSEAKKILRIG